MIPREAWKQFAKPSHFICADRCRFGRSTVVGDVVVSTVGDFHSGAPDGLGMDILGQPPHPSGAEWIGFGRFYETMVFRYDGFCTIKDCPCGGVPNINPRELDFRGYQTEAEATAGHEAMCEEWAAKDGPEPKPTRMGALDFGDDEPEKKP